jgi:hypothetical protein
MTRITSSTSVGLNLNPALYTSPIVIDHGVTVSNPFYPSAVYSDPSDPAKFAIRNRGVITGGSAGIGIDLAAGGTVVNGKAGVITGYVGIEMSGGYGVVINRSAIVGAHESGTFRYRQIGIDLQTGGAVINATGALISSLSVGVDIYGGAASVINYGTIMSAGGSSNNGPNSIGIDMQSGGYVGNGIGGVISGASEAIEIGDGSDRHGGSGATTAGTVVNYGTIDGGVSGASLLSGGWLGNGAHASISGGGNGVAIGRGDAGTVINYGSIAGTSSEAVGVFTYATGLIVNAVGGSITGIGGGIALAAAATLINYGNISGGTGVGFATFFTAIGGAPGAVAINTAAATITGANFGVAIADGGTVINAGTIIGNSGTAVYGYDTYGNNRLVLYPGFAFGGLVVGDKYTSNTLELASTSSTGTVTGLGTEFVHFGSIVFDPGAQWSVAGLARAFDGPISGFAAGDAIDLTDLKANSYTNSAGTLTLLENGKPVQSMTISTPYSASHFYVNPDGSSGTLLTVAPAAGANTFTFDDVSQAAQAGINLQAYPSGSTATTAPPYPSNPLMAANSIHTVSSALPQSYAHTGLVPPS